MSRPTCTRLLTRAISYRAPVTSRPVGKSDLRLILKVWNASASRSPLDQRRLYSTTSKGASNSGKRYTQEIILASAVCLTVALSAYSVRRVRSESSRTASPSVKYESSVFETNYASPEELQLAIQELRKTFPGEHVVETDSETLRFYGSSENSYHPTSPHSVVVRMHSTEDVVKVVNLSRKYRVPLTAYSGATSLEGHFSGVRALQVLRVQMLKILSLVPVWKYLLGYVWHG
jgi:D-lactate dehydrogenase (cytochrome)